MSKRSLGKGLSELINTKSLFSSVPSEELGEKISLIKVDRISPNPYQPRKVIREEELEELTQSIKEKGLLQPVIVRQQKENQFELIAGERRWRSAIRAGLETIPAIIRRASDNDLIEIALMENLQRSDLNPIEEARGYALMMEKFGLTQEVVAQRLGKSRATVANTLRLLTLSQPVQDLIEKGSLSQGHGKVLVGLTDREMQEKVAEKIVKEGWSVRKTEEFVGNYNEKKKKSLVVQKEREADFLFTNIEKELCVKFGSPVKIKGDKNSGKIEITFRSIQDLHRVLGFLGISF
ncbi:chromosome partitioning protein ParB [Candidatus Methylacidiphilum fumarolicum]|uniref:Chromosome (Plasmid) partitioning protein,ParB/Spo0J family n=2 Tax=Candidatus Methylacidiphilum fumarolicum TaxID=591154 RepID=I0K1E3_METFB|nr:ParB/RepB/Spo0J family partition protein [Candidatus Methylacidiphilum fumarolicum]MBW6414932.1 ParB/RepB/Spo0J family partition protein [Candidatus Methylacidiphilum fumarolicum]TFE70375.1 chromosome partitioning protein ParB [Candidatus Methylacidiphilum fumarolicum]TFE73944.1 chromosome partitioning protein ParB [Candidatus Methylacidiphilum fumarolicum]TFE74450.1 chromosome partitioning protein ParB [Candidatus Methylacidiphilum fumarolicum]TFE77888.1 chromosome partitioning protein Par